jgi:hypothetical protein
VWTLGAGQSRRVADAAAWNAPKKSGGGSTGERSTAAGRHAEREGADTAASVVAPGAKAESTSAVTASGAPSDPAPAEPQSVMRRGDDAPEKETETAKAEEVADKPEPPDRSSKKSAKEPAKDVSGGGGGGGCDEVACLLADPAPACCNKYNRRKPADAPKGEGGSDLPEALGRTEVKEGIDKVRARALGCGDGTSVKGQVKVAVKVNPDGTVASVTVKETPDEALGACVAGVVKTATFARSQTGGSFTYPFSF